jgi:hypothetical protein
MSATFWYVTAAVVLLVRGDGEKCIIKSGTDMPNAPQIAGLHGIADAAACCAACLERNQPDHFCAAFVFQKDGQCSLKGKAAPTVPSGSISSGIRSAGPKPGPTPKPQPTPTPQPKPTPKSKPSPAPPPATFGFSSMFSSSMVLQRAPSKSAVYGHLGTPCVTKAAAASIQVTVDGVSEGGQHLLYTVAAEINADAQTWKAFLKPSEQGGNYTIKAACTSGCTGSASINDTTFGDVVSCHCTGCSSAVFVGESNLFVCICLSASV